MGDKSNHAHSHSHGHSRGHSHSHTHGLGGLTSNGEGSISQRRALVISTGANGLLLIIQVVIGLALGSLALLADSLHNASDVVALCVALVGQVLATRPATAQRTYGLARAEILAALLNGVVLFALTGWVIIEAIGRFGQPHELRAAPLVIIGLLGLIVNGGSAWLLSRTGGTNLNIRAAFWHLLSDALGSVGVAVAGLAVHFFDAAWTDPAVSILISVLVLIGVWNLLKDTVEVLLESTPPGVDLDEITDLLESVEGVRAAHHLHVWSVDSQTVALTAHLLMDDGVDLHAAQQSMNVARQQLAETFGVTHATLEPECHDCDVPTHVP